MKFGVDLHISSTSSCVSVNSVRKRAYMLESINEIVPIFSFFALLQFGIEDLVLKLLNNFEFHKNQDSQRRHVRT